MIHSKIDKGKSKGWYLGPWNSKVSIPIGFAVKGINEKHYHERMFEIYLVASGESIVVVGGKTVKLKSGDILVVEPNEVHSFTNNSDDYMHFVLHVPFVKDDKVLVK